MHNFQLVNIDTDAVAFCRQDMKPFTEEEKNQLLDELNTLYPKEIKFADDGYFSCMIVLAAKNYVMLTPEGKIKIKGSALKSANKEPVLKEFQREVINYILFNEDYKPEVITTIYHKYIKEAMNIQDINRWVSKKTISHTTLTSERTNETSIIKALEGEEYSEGDKVYMYYNKEDQLTLAKKYDGCYNVDRMLGKLFSTSKVFDTILPKGTFLNYSLKKNKKLLEELS